MLLTKSKAVRLTCGFLETFSFLALKLWLKNPAAAKAFSGRVFRDYMSVVGQDRWRCAPIEEVLPGFSGCRVTFDYLVGGGIDTLVEDLACLALLTKHLAPRAVFEIGTFRGRATLIFADNSPADAVIHTLDLGPTDRDQAKREASAADAAVIEDSVTGIDYKGKPGAEKIRQHFGDSTRFDFRPFRGRMDLVFVDGAHHYDAVLSDTRHALELARPGGFVVWHDWASYGDYNDVMRAVLKLIPGREIVQIGSSRLAVYRQPA